MSGTWRGNPPIRPQGAQEAQEAPLAPPGAPEAQAAAQGAQEAPGGPQAAPGGPPAPPVAAAMVPAVLARTGAVAAPGSLAERLASYRQLGWWIANAEGTATPQAGSAGALRFYYADALDLPPLAAQELWIDQRGKLNVSSKLLRAVAESRGYLVRPVEWDDQSCTAVLLLEGVELGRYTFTIKQAERAGLLRERSAWRSFPERMLFARATKFLLDTYAPGIMLGMDTADELETELPWPESDPGADPEPVAADDNDDIPF